MPGEWRLTKSNWPMGRKSQYGLLACDAPRYGAYKSPSVINDRFSTSRTYCYRLRIIIARGISASSELATPPVAQLRKIWPVRPAPLYRGFAHFPLLISHGARGYRRRSPRGQQAVIIIFTRRYIVTRWTGIHPERSAILRPARRARYVQ